MSSIENFVDYENGETPMTDFQFKQIIEMVYQILKANIEAGKSPEEILKIVAALKNGTENENKQLNIVAA